MSDVDPAAGGGNGVDDRVPSSRLREETRAKRDALARVGELEATVADLEKRGATVETLTKRIGEVELERDNERSGRLFDRAVVSKGITDPEGIDLAQAQYARLPAKDRPAPDAWLDLLTKEADKIPRWLAGYLPVLADPATPPSARPTVTAATRPATTATAAGAGGDQSLDAAKARITELSEQAQRTGDWKAYDAERPALLARIAKG
jgi:hypothetical protein